MTMPLHPYRSARTSIFAAIAVLTIYTGCFSTPVSADSQQLYILQEDFGSLDQWEPLKFKNIENMSTYSIEPQADGTSYMKAQSSNSASGMVWKGEFNVYDHPVIRWRWKVSNIYATGNALEKKGDDYPLRIYVLFRYDPEDPNVNKKFKYGLGKLLYGEYPPYASINYIWANRAHSKQLIPNPYAKEAMMVPLRSGPSLAGQWVMEERNILSDYREAFGTDPPAKAGLAFMNDSDNTGEASESWLDHIQILRKTENPLAPPPSPSDPAMGNSLPSS